MLVVAAVLCGSGCGGGFVLVCGCGCGCGWCVVVVLVYVNANQYTWPTYGRRRPLFCAAQAPETTIDQTPHAHTKMEGSLIERVVRCTSSFPRHSV